jgi:hypothetical protein
MPALVLLFWFLGVLPPPDVPRLEIESPPELATIGSRLQAFAGNGMGDIGEFLGIRESGPPIRVVLSPENSELARRVAPWIAGFAVGESSLVVIFPARSPGYPDNTLEDVLRHEVAHILIRRASGGLRVPRWFDEGLAMEVERQRRFRDQTQLFYQLVTGGETDLHHMDQLFSGGETDQTRAYALAGAFVHDLLRQHGPTVCKNILMQIGRGIPFDVAFADVIGVTPSHAASEFWKHQRIWTAWIPIITSTTTLWLSVTLLALLAIYVRRRRNRQIEEQWDKEDGTDPGEQN